MASKRESQPGQSAGGDDPKGAPRGAGSTAVEARPRRYLIAPRAGVAGQFRPMSTDALQTTLDNMADVTVVRRLKPRSLGMLSATGGGGGHEILVAEMSLERGEALRANAPADVVIEHDDLLRHADAPNAGDFALLDSHAGTGATAAARVTAEVRLKIVDGKGKAVPKAAVTVYGQAFPAQGTTDEAGAVTLSVAGGTIDSVRAVYVKPLANYWDRFIMRPQFGEAQVNTIAVKSLSETFEGFPKKGMTGWGQKLMGLDGIDSAERGKGIKIGIIDSGCDNTHPQLRHVVNGADLVSDDGGDGWTNDEMAHGTHCAGIIGARSSEAQAGITGFAPAAEIHAYKVFPGGRFSDLIEALDMAIADEVDVLNMSLGSDQPSELVGQKLRAAVESGIVCIVAAGNSSGPVQFPGVLPEAITIAAIGQTGQFPDDSYHALTVGPGGVGADGVFSAKFSCFGPEVKMSAPGVAIVSTVPGGYAAWDGTSMAAPHVTGLAALLLAHHPLLRGRPRAGRVAALWEVLRNSAVPAVADPLRGGAGVPSASALAGATAVGSTPAMPAQRPVAPGLPGSVPDSPGAGPPPRQAYAPIQASAGPVMTPEMLMAYYYSNPALFQALLLRHMQLQAAGLR